jgi:hypothetical protein
MPSLLSIFDSQIARHTTCGLPVCVTFYLGLCHTDVNVPVLDPRVTYQGLLHFFEDDLELSSDVRSSRIAFEKHFLDTYASTPNAQTPTSRPEMIDPRSRKGSARIFASYGASRATLPPSQPQLELDTLFSMGPLPFETTPDPVKWWAGRLSQFPTLSLIARDILSIPGKLWCTLFIWQHN